MPWLPHLPSICYLSTVLVHVNFTITVKYEHTRSSTSEMLQKFSGKLDSKLVDYVPWDP